MARTAGTVPDNPKVKTRRFGFVGSRVRAAFGVALCLLVPALVQAHVKWFSQFTYADRPRSLGGVTTPTFFALAALSTVTVGALAFVGRWVRATDVGKRLEPGSTASAARPPPCCASVRGRRC